MNGMIWLGNFKNAKLQDVSSEIAKVLDGKPFTKIILFPGENNTLSGELWLEDYIRFDNLEIERPASKKIEKRPKIEVTNLIF